MTYVLIALFAALNIADAVTIYIGLRNSNVRAYGVYNNLKVIRRA